MNEESVYVMETEGHDVKAVFWSGMKKQNGGYLFPDPEHAERVIVTNRISENKKQYVVMASKDGKSFGMICALYIDGELVDIRKMRDSIEEINK